MKKFEITEEQLKAILSYLASKPFGEVHEGVSMLSNLPEIKEEKKE